MAREKQKQADPRAQQIYALKALSKSRRDQFLGMQWFDTARQLFELEAGTTTSAVPSWRPNLNIPQLQVLMMNEATDLAGINPRVIISKRGSSERDKEREKAFRDHWRLMGAPIALLMAELWSMFAGTGWLWSGFDPLGYGGNGQVWLNWLDPENVHADPFAKLNVASGILDWSYVVVETELSLDEIRLRHSHLGEGPGQLVTAERATPASTAAIPQVGANPPYPTQTLFGPSSPPEAASWDSPRSKGSIVPVNICFTKDYTEDKTESKAREKKVGELEGVKIPAPRLKYPWGRMLIESDGVILYDDRNPWGGMGGRTLFPIIPIWSMPPLTSVWAPPPPRLSLPLQNLAGKMYSQLYENMYRTNNATWFLSEATGIDPNDFGALPAEIVMHASGSPVPQATWPGQMPAHMMQGPALLLEWARILQGQTPQRQGDAGKGNISPDLFEAAVGQASKMTQMRAMFLYQSIQALSEVIYYSMCRWYKTSRMFPSFSGTDEDDEPGISTWEPGEEGNIQVHPGSISVVSGAAMKRYVIALRQAGLISRRTALEELEFPHAEEVSEELDREEALAALSKTKRR